MQMCRQRKRTIVRRKAPRQATFKMLNLMSFPVPLPSEPCTSDEVLDSIVIEQVSKKLTVIERMFRAPDTTSLGITARELLKQATAIARIYKR